MNIDVQTLIIIILIAFIIGFVMGVTIAVPRFFR
jgi:hypothetical protein